MEHAINLEEVMGSNSKPSIEFEATEVGVMMEILVYRANVAAAKKFGYDWDRQREELERFRAEHRLEGDFKEICHQELTSLVAENPVAYALIQALAKKEAGIDSSRRIGMFGSLASTYNTTH